MLSLVLAFPARSQTHSAAIGTDGVAPAMQRLAVRIEANPALSQFIEEMGEAGVEDPFGMVGEADLKTMPDSVLASFPGLISSALRESDASACRVLMSKGTGLGEETFNALLAASDSATVEGWLVLVESMLVAYAHGDKGSPPPSPARVQSLMISAASRMSDVDREALLTTPTEDQPPAPEQECGKMRSLFGAISGLGLTERAELMRGLMVMGEAEE
jgi:hypothetical protein